MRQVGVGGQRAVSEEEFPLSSASLSRRGRLRVVGIAAASVTLGLSAALALPTSPAGAAAAPTSGRVTPSGSPDAIRAYPPGRYIVALKAPAAASYGGTSSRYAATKAAGNGSFKADSRAVERYSAHLEATQTSLARSVGATVAQHTTIALNSFVANLSAEQATKLANDKSVAFVQKDALRKLDTFNTPNFLGLDGSDGAWNAHGGEAKAGDGVVVGDIDSGIWPSTGSFKGSALTSSPSTKWDISMDADGNTRMEKADGTAFTGVCQTGARFTTSMCNSKLISARVYPDAYLAGTDPADRPDSEFISPRDGSGHGSHTASTAVGNPVDNVKVEDRLFGTISGMAPAAKLAVYKVCFENVDPDLSGCANSAILAAIDDAVLDGVDLINFSISGATDTVVDLVELAFEGAAEAGVFVSASAGNSGPTESTVAHNSPWLTTVAAGTHVNFENTIVLSDRTKLVGASINGTPLPRTPLVYAEDSVVTGGDATDAKICGPDTLDAAKVADKVVICYRGVYDRVAKSAEVKRAGGAAMILVNPSPNSLDADFHAVPSVHISDTDGAKLDHYMDINPHPSALFAVGNRTDTVTPLPQVAGFSSVGPAIANDGDLLKPDITAPGASVLAAVAPPSNAGRRFDLYSGTSMSSPHILGLAAFIQGVHPKWTPMEIKSAMMTTASKMLNAKGKTTTDVFAVGSGQVQPKKFFNPGLFVTETPRNWQGFLTGQGYDTGVPALEANQLNLPSFADGAVAGSVSLKRTFRATETGTWKTRVYLPGFDVTASPRKVVSHRAGDLIDVTFTFTRTTATLDSYAKGAITLAGPTKVRMAVAMKPVAVAAPTAVTGSGATGSVNVPITAGNTGSITLTTTGLVAPDAASYTDAVAINDFAYDCWSATPGTTKTAVFDVDAADDTADLDLTVYSATACDLDTIDGVAGTSATGSADERVVIADPDHPVYITEVAGYAAGSDGTDPIAYTNSYYDIGGAAEVGDLTVAPNPVPVVQGEETSYDASWTGLADGRYFGLVGYAGSSATTLLEVTAP